MATIDSKIAFATKWSSLAEVAAKIILPVVNMILARLLTPEAFGIVATVNIVITFAEVFQDAGFQKYMIQHEFASSEEFDESANVAFWSNLALSIFLWLIIVLFCDNIASFIGAESLGLEIIVASFSLPVFAVSSIQTAYYRREFEFKKLFWVRLFTALIPLVVTVPLALIFHNHWALIIGTLLRNIVQTIILYKGAKWKPRFFYRIKRLREMLSFCMWTLLESVSIWVTSNASTFIVTRVMGVETVGYFKTSMSTVTSIISIVSSATVTVLFAALSRLQHDDEKFKGIFYNYQAVIGILVMPMGAGMFVFRDVVTKIMLGSQWMECANFIGMYSMVTALAVVTNSFFSELYRAKGKPKVSTFAQILYLCILIPSVYISSKYGFEVLCITTTLNILWFMLIHFIIVKFMFKMNIWIMIKNLFLIGIPTSIMAIAGALLKQLNSAILWQFISIACCVIIYFIIVMLIRPLRNLLKTSELTSAAYAKIMRIKPWS